MPASTATSPGRISTGGRMPIIWPKSMPMLQMKMGSIHEATPSKATTTAK